MKRYFRSAHLTLIFAAVTFLTGMLMGVALFGTMAAFAKDRYLDLQLFTKVLNLVQQYYVEEVNTRNLIYGGVKGMLRELDPHTNFLPPEIYKEFESETSGEFAGLGVEITVQKGILTVISAVEDTPAWKAGLKAGDKIVTIDGESTKGLSLVEAAQKMRGKRGSKVKLGIFREGFEEPKVYVIERGVVKIKSVKYTDLEDGYGFIRLTSFMENSQPELAKVIEDHRNKYKSIKGLIIDLRKNPGGLLDQAIRISDMFLNEGVIVSTIGRNQKEKEVVQAKKKGTLEDFPLIVLIDEYSASASEILAGALQDHKRALIMGQKSFGKGSVQSVVKLGDGSGLKLTVARYYTPSGRSIQAEGIQPDILVENIDSMALDKAVIKNHVRREVDIEGHLLSEKEKAVKSKKGDSTVGLQFWWDEDKASKKKLSPKEKLLKEDFQALQAYNYLLAWKVMEKFRTPGTPLAKPTGEAATN